MKLWRTALGAALAFACLLIGAPAAADNMAVRDALGVYRQVCTRTQGGAEIPCEVFFVLQPDGTYGPAVAALPFTLKGQASLAVSTASGRVALPTADASLILQNTGTVDVAFKLGGSTVTAATTDFLLGAGKWIGVSSGGQTYIAAITSSGSSTLAVTTGTGTPVLGGGGGSAGGGGGGDASAANQSTQITAANTTNTNLGAPGATACATDNGSCSINALLQRIAQRETSFIAALGSPFQAGGIIGNTAFGISGTLPAFATIPAFKTDLTTPGTTNKVYIGSDGSVGILTATTTAAPSYTNGTSNAASTDTHGGLRTTLQDSTGASVDFSYAVTSTSGSSTVTTGGTFQSALASNANRKGCLIQNPATATENLLVFFGATGSATTATSFSLPAGAAISCATGAGFVLTDNVAVTGATTGHAYILVSQ